MSDLASRRPSTGARMTRPAVLVLAGLDPSGGAGLLADAEAIRSCGARPFCLATALTVQTTSRAFRFESIRAALVADQAQALLGEEPASALKIGMLGNLEMLRAAAAIAAQAEVPFVVDPVLFASSGAPLFDGDPAAYRELFAQGALVTPNLAECRLLLSLDADPATADEMLSAGRKLLALGAHAVLVKGGHLHGPDALDLLVTDSGGVHELHGPRIAASKRGTGCRLSSALAAYLASGQALLGAAHLAKAHVAAYLRAPVG